MSVKHAHVLVVLLVTIGLATSVAITGRAADVVSASDLLVRVRFENTASTSDGTSSYRAFSGTGYHV